MQDGRREEVGKRHWKMDTGKKAVVVESVEYEGAEFGWNMSDEGMNDWSVVGGAENTSWNLL